MGEDRKMAVVNVFGAGIAGLTVAHELAERGFTVRVIDTKLAPLAHSGIAASALRRHTAKRPGTT